MHKFCAVSDSDTTTRGQKIQLLLMRVDRVEYLLDQSSCLINDGKGPIFVRSDEIHVYNVKWIDSLKNTWIDQNVTLVACRGATSSAKLACRLVEGWENKEWINFVCALSC